MSSEDFGVVSTAQRILALPESEQLAAVDVALNTSLLYPSGTPEHAQALSRQAQLVTLIRETCKARRRNTPWREDLPADDARLLRLRPS